MSRPQLPTEFLRDLLRCILKEEGLDISISYDVMCGVGGHQENWMTSVYRVVVFPDKKDINRRRSLFFKCLPASNARSEAFHTTVFFKNEVQFYDQVLPALLNFQHRRRRRGMTTFKGTARCYKALSDGENDVLVMEDLQSRGYVMLDRLKGMHVDEVRAMIEELGRFHALSLAMKDQDAVGFATARSTIAECLFTDLQSQIFGRFFEVSCKDALGLVKGKYADDSPYVVKMESFAADVYRRMWRAATPDPMDEQFNVITHGDLWINNFLFHYKDTGVSSLVDRMCFIDFQVCRYSCLALDVACVLFLSLDVDARAQHRDSLLLSYHTALSRLLVDLGSDPQRILPYDVLEGLLTKYSQFAVGMACLNLPIQLYDGEGSDVDLETLGGGTEAVVEAVLAALARKPESCKQRIIDVVTEAVDRGYL